MSVVTAEQKPGEPNPEMATESETTKTGRALDSARGLNHHLQGLHDLVSRSERSTSAKEVESLDAQVFAVRGTVKLMLEHLTEDLALLGIK